MLCPKCQVQMTHGLAMGQTVNKGRPGQTLYTQYPCGPGFLKSCLKCHQCGYSMEVVPQEKEKL